MLDRIIDQIEDADTIEELTVVVRDLLDNTYKKGFNKGYKFGYNQGAEDVEDEFLFEDDGA